METLDSLIEPVAGWAADRISAALAAGEEVVIRVGSDLAPDGRFGGQWVVVTDRRVLIVRDEGDQGMLEVPLTELERASTESLVGGGCLHLERRGAPTVEVLYSSSLGTRFSEVARGLEQLRQGKERPPAPQLDRLRCARCGRLLPEKNGICPACIEKLATLKRIVGYMAPYKGRAAVLAVASAAVTAAELAPPMITKWIVDRVLMPPAETAAPLEARFRLLGVLVLGLIGVRLLSWAGEWVHGWIMAWMGARVTADIRSQLYRRLEMLSLGFYDKRQVGSLMSRVTRDAGRLQEFLVNGLPYLIINGLMIVGILGFLVYLSWRLSLYIILPVPLMVAWGMFFWKRMHRFFHRWGEVWEKLTERTNEALNGIRVVKAFAQEKREIAAFAEPNRRLRQVAVETQLNRGIFFATMTLLTGLGVLIVWLLGGRQVVREEITLGTLLAFYSYMWLFYGPLEWVALVNTWMTQSFAGAERIFEVIDAVPEAYEDSQAVRMPQIAGGIRFTEVSFGYDKSKPVLRDLDLEIAAGRDGRAGRHARGWARRPP
jgi:ATP-binding cassette, subfamily B, bacterial